MTKDTGTYSRLAEIAEETTDPSKVLPVERPIVRLNERPTVRLNERPSGAPKQPSTRPMDHRAYDFFTDQVNWLNRRRLELKERYGRLVPATLMVQLALDLFIKDFEQHGESSQLVRVLINGEQFAVGPEAQDSTKAGGDG